MAELRINGQAQGTAQPQRKAQPQKKENIVIEFTSLPDNMKTAKVRAFYDKDGSGFIESNNANGQNEVALMQQAFGLDLSKYKSNITKVVHTECNHEYPRKMSRTYDSNGKWVRDLEIYDDGDVYTYEKSMTQSKFSKGYAASNYALILEQKINSRGGADNKIEKLDNGMTYYADYKTKHSVLKDKKGKIVASRDWSNGKNEFNLYQDKVLVKGKNTLVATHCYSGTDEIKNGILIQSGDVIPNDVKKLSLTNTTYTLNGKKVQAKPIGKGRYEVTTEKGNIYYISHDGVNLKPEYVRNNP